MLEPPFKKNVFIVIVNAIIIYLTPGITVPLFVPSYFVLNLLDLTYKQHEQKNKPAENELPVIN